MIKTHPGCMTYEEALEWLKGREKYVLQFQHTRARHKAVKDALEKPQIPPQANKIRRII